MEKTKVLFVDLHNSACSQMAEAFLHQSFENEFHAESAGLEPDKLNPIVVEVMKEVNIDISNNRTKNISDFLKESPSSIFIITLCDKANNEHCPIFSGIARQINWSFKDPSSFTGTHEEILAETRLVRDKIKSRVENFTETHHLVKF